jgi:hypothetical protein
MTCGRVQSVGAVWALEGAAVSHSAELVRGDYNHEGPLIRPSCRRRVFDTTGTFSPRGEGTVRPQLEYQRRLRPHHVCPASCSP